MTTSESPRRAYRYFSLVMALFVAVLLISNIASTKILNLGPFAFDGGTILFPLSYIFGDILTEVYGYRRSREVIWTGFACALLMAGTLALVGWLPPDPQWPHQEAYQAILGLTPRIVAASLVAYFAGEFSNSFTLAKMKVRTGGRWLWARTIGSTLVGQGVDTLLFVLIAFWGVLPPALLASVILSNYAFKTGIEVAATPLTYLVVGRLKQVEQEDHFDYDTDFNPFRLAS
ncbi:MAG: queuosine precursor transporter [Chloroflexi bacterium]|nr:queuosine precursor transporter [Chloroflexota bacterium]